MKYIKCKLHCWEDVKNEDLGIEDDGIWTDFIFDLEKVDAFYRRKSDITLPEYYNTIIYINGESFVINIDFESIKEEIEKL